jgi:hypothetical protein
MISKYVENKEMSWKSLRFNNDQHEFEFKFISLEEVKYRVLFLIIGAILGNVYLELYFW